jgi:hypothetical protein
MKGTRVWGRAVDYVRFHLMSLLLGLGGRLGPQDIDRDVAAVDHRCSSLVPRRALARALGMQVAELYPDLAIEQGVIRTLRQLRS